MNSSKPLKVIDVSYNPVRDEYLITVDDGRKVYVTAEEIEENFTYRFKTQTLRILAQKNCKEKVQFT